MSGPILDRDAARALLDWYAASGVETAEVDEAGGVVDWPRSGYPAARRLRARVAPAPPALAPAGSLASEATGNPAPIASYGAETDPVSTEEAVALAREAADAAPDIGALTAAIAAFTACPLRDGAQNAVVHDGIPGAPLLVIGEGPGQEEDRTGKPFVGRAGQLLDRMLGAIGASRQEGEGEIPVSITNAVYWRPPGNRTPTPEEIAICHPFLRRFIELSGPRVIVLAGNVPNRALFPDAGGITRTRGQWRSWPGPDGDIPVMPIFHPAFLLRQPAQKALTWQDLLSIADRLSRRGTAHH